MFLGGQGCLVVIHTEKSIRNRIVCRQVRVIGRSTDIENPAQEQPHNCLSDSLVRFLAEIGCDVCLHSRSERVTSRLFPLVHLHVCQQFVRH